MMTSKRLLAVAVSAALYAPLSAFATNGMMMEGYGPIATGMGGASMAYDNGTAAMMNNPATLGLMADGSRLDIAVGLLQPDVTWDMGAGGSYSSASDSFMMPAIGWVKKSGAMAYGVGVFAQGGMGTDYKGVAGMGDFYSQVGVGRLIVPFAYNVNEQLSIGATLDYVWANMDMQYGAIFEFKDSSDFSGEATGDGFAGKLGIVYKVNDQLNVGATYHTAGGISDLDGASGTVLGNPATFTFKGFDMPPVLALGVSFKANDALMVVADVKQIMWSETMTTPVLEINMGGITMPLPMQQDWDDQTVIQLGAAYKFNAEMTGRIGANIASNPIPDEFLNPLFPAIVENHYTLGFGYDINPASSVNASLSYAPEVTATSPGGFDMKHSQTNLQVMYSHRF